jgi:hypothetical protein
MKRKKITLFLGLKSESHGFAHAVRVCVFIKRQKAIPLESMNECVNSNNKSLGEVQQVSSSICVVQAAQEEEQKEEVQEELCCVHFCTFLIIHWQQDGVFHNNCLHFEVRI